jgi:hypothetical protein
MPVILVVSYLLSESGISCGARKLAQSPLVVKNRKKNDDVRSCLWNNSPSRALAFCDVFSKRENDDTTNPQQMTFFSHKTRGDWERKNMLRWGLLSYYIYILISLIYIYIWWNMYNNLFTFTIMNAAKAKLRTKKHYFTMSFILNYYRLYYSFYKNIQLSMFK